MITNERIDAIAESMPGGMDGFLKGWGWQQFARAIEDEVRKADAALIERLHDALDDGAEHGAGCKRHYWSCACDCDKSGAIAAARARLLDSDLSKLTERGKEAWLGVDAQKLREGGGL